MPNKCKTPRSLKFCSRVIFAPFLQHVAEDEIVQEIKTLPECTNFPANLKANRFSLDLWFLRLIYIASQNLSTSSSTRLQFSLTYLAPCIAKTANAWGILKNDARLILLLILAASDHHCANCTNEHPYTDPNCPKYVQTNQISMLPPLRRHIKIVHLLQILIILVHLLIQILLKYVKYTLF